MAKTNPDRIRICAFCSFIAIPVVVNIASDWFVFYCEGKDSGHELVSDSLSHWWLGLSIFGTVVGLIVILLECCCCLASNNPDDQVCASQWVFLATLLEDLPLLVISSITLYYMPSNRCECEATEYVLIAFIISSAMSLLVAVIRLLKLCTLCCPTFDECKIKICLFLFLLHLGTALLGLSVLVVSIRFTCS